MLDNEYWSDVLQVDCPNNILCLINDKIFDMYNTCFPLTTRKVRIYKTKLRPWMTSALLKSCKTKNKLYKIYLRHKTEESLFNYKKYKNKLTLLLRNSERLYYASMFELHNNNLRKTWKLIKQVMGHSNSHQTSVPLSVDNQLTSDPSLIAREFNKFFVGIGPNMATNIPPTSCNYNDYLKDPNPNSLFLLLPTNMKSTILSLILR